MRPTRALLALAGLALAFGCGDEPPNPMGKTRPVAAAKAPPASPGSATAAGAAPAPPPMPTATPLAGDRATSYPETAEGLGLMAKELLAAAHARDESTLARLLESLRLREPEAWFAATFGKQLGKELLLEYKTVRDEIGQLAPVLQALAAGGQTKLTIERFDQADQPASVGYQSAALAKMARPASLYSVRFGSEDGKKLFHLWSFVYQEGTFRYVGKMKRIIEAQASTGLDRLELRLRDAEGARTSGG